MVVMLLALVGGAWRCFVCCCAGSKAGRFIGFGCCWATTTTTTTTMHGCKTTTTVRACMQCRQQLRASHDRRGSGSKAGVGSR
eukprot:836307-Rhodomonas_salina.1